MATPEQFVEAARRKIAPKAVEYRIGQEMHAVSFDNGGWPFDVLVNEEEADAVATPIFKEAQLSRTIDDLHTKIEKLKDEHLDEVKTIEKVTDSQGDRIAELEVQLETAKPWAPTLEQAAEICRRFFKNATSNVPQDMQEAITHVLGLKPAPLALQPIVVDDAACKIATDAYWDATKNDIRAIVEALAAYWGKPEPKLVELTEDELRAIGSKHGGAYDTLVLAINARLREKAGEK